MTKFNMVLFTSASALIIGVVACTALLVHDIATLPEPTCKNTSIQVADIMSITVRNGNTYAISSTNGTLYSFDGRSEDFQKGKCFLISHCSAKYNPGPYIKNYVEQPCHPKN